jgi:predicted PurR-regulated permease PerM
VLSLIASLLRLVSIVICLIVAASFLIFVVEQTSSASTQQQEELGVHKTPANAPAGTGTPAPPPAKHESTLHKKIDEASNELTSPFSEITSGSSSQWLIRGVNLLLTLLIYGFVLSFLARAIRVRA